MNLPKNYVLKPGQLADPILWRGTLAPPEGGFVPKATAIKMLFAIFGAGKGSRLQTWARDPNDPDGPHWIGVRQGTGLHTDPRYPRYTHQLVVYNDGWAVGGFKKIVTPDPWTVGTVFCLDTHSPHILLADPRLRVHGNAWYYLAASMDSKVPLSQEQSVPRLLDFVARSVKQFTSEVSQRQS